MNGNSILVDTNIVLYLLGGDKTIIPLLQDKQLFVSFITQLELLSFKNLTKNQIIKIEKFLSECTIVDINSKIKEHTINIRRKNLIKLPDCIIIATSLYLNVPLISADSQFNKIKEFNLILYQK
ncbi:MAG: type II toxin-antitoxin system VapC family toxin [Bacteroidetes bacterium]|nr:type II toxin-antitoxin system VapC family toxin [Bacteroidota bacterium]MBU1681116.1 type II toxin-antitoxin system VapC family toxin [Bacteroidota bacterium]MBU2505610.1 type II toxin-antitoxin system VapC family toxin [Bacteroidota bacterium]